MTKKFFPPVECPLRRGRSPGSGAHRGEHREDHPRRSDEEPPGHLGARKLDHPVSCPACIEILPPFTLPLLFLPSSLLLPSVSLPLQLTTVVRSFG